jgi:hypothetical protein
MDYFRARAPRSALADLMRDSTQITTDCPDKIDLDPWISWPTLHRGVNDEKHGIFHLGQMMDKADAAFPPIWRLLASAGKQVGVFGSVHSGHIPRDVDRYDFYITDFFDDEVFAKPDYLKPFQRFNLGMTRRSTRNVDTKIPLDLFLDFVRSSPRLGISTETVSAIVHQLVAERREPRLRLRRRSLQTLLMGDAFLNLMKSSNPNFATFYTNSVAASMHRYWAAAFPDDIHAANMPDEWRRDYAQELYEAMTVMDRLLRKVRAFADRNDSILMVTGSMGQDNIPSGPSKNALTITNIDKFMAALGLTPDQYRPRHAMAPCLGVVLNSEALVDKVTSQLDQITLDGSRFERKDEVGGTLAYGVYPGNFVHFYTYFDSYQGPLVISIGNHEVSLEDAGFGLMQHEDNVGCTAQHVPEGALLVYDPANKRPDQRRAIISTTEIAPALLDHFRVPIPAYMRTKPGLLKTALHGGVPTRAERLKTA